MRKDLMSSAVAVVAFTVLFGLAYPLVVTGLSQVIFPGRADGSQVKVDGRVVGSRLLGQDFGTRDDEGTLTPDPRYFQTRPSQSANNPSATFFSNLGPNSADLRDQIAANAQAYLALEGPDNPGLTLGDVPGDAVQTSGSGVDPHISPANARIQAARVARERGLDRGAVLDAIEEHTDDRALGVLGEPGVNVLELNLALDAEASR